MNLKEILELPTEELEKLTDPQLIQLLGPLIPASRQEDKDSALKRDTKMLIAQAQKLLGTK